MIRVVAGYVENDNKVLIAKRSHGIEINNWEFPGGKLEENETDQEALKREMREELNIDVEVNELIKTVEHQDVNKKFSLSLYRCKYISGEIKLSAHFRYKWITPSEINNYKMPPADQKLVDYLLETQLIK